MRPFQWRRSALDRSSLAAVYASNHVASECDPRIRFAASLTRFDVADLADDQPLPRHRRSPFRS